MFRGVYGIRRFDLLMIRSVDVISIETPPMTAGVFADSIRAEKRKKKDEKHTGTAVAFSDFSSDYSTQLYVITRYKIDRYSRYTAVCLWLIECKIDKKYKDILLFFFNFDLMDIYLKC